MIPNWLAVLTAVVSGLAAGALVLVIGLPRPLPLPYDAEWRKVNDTFTVIWWWTRAVWRLVADTCVRGVIMVLPMGLRTRWYQRTLRRVEAKLRAQIAREPRPPRAPPGYPVVPLPREEKTAVVRP